VDQSRDLFAYEFAGNILKTVDRDAVLIVQGDNLWPLWYRNVVEDLRPDVTVLSLSLINAAWYVNQVLGRSPGMPVKLTEEEKAELGPKAWEGDSVFAIPVPQSTKIALAKAGIVATDTVHLHAPPPVYMNLLLPQEWLLVAMIRENEWKRPIYFTDVPPWLAPNCRTEGIVHRLIPSDAPAIDCALLRRNLFEDYECRRGSLGGAAVADPLAWMSRSAAERYVHAFVQLAECEEQRGNTKGAVEARRRASTLFPEVVSDSL
jgi:hypothetical protein